jgi:TRAP-type C4-dicarboxylate transport system permease large subunit
MEGFLVVLVVSAGIVEGIHEIVLIIKMNLEQVLPPIFCDFLYSLDAFGSQYIHDSLRELCLCLSELILHLLELSHHRAIILCLSLEQ